jgi:hypothetical protein
VGLPDTFSRVVRGGSWNNNQDNARTAYRNNNTPDNRNNNLGFRVCCVSHIDPRFFMHAVFSCIGYVIPMGLA